MVADQGWEERDRGDVLHVLSVLIWNPRVELTRDAPQEGSQIAEMVGAVDHRFREHARPTRFSFGAAGEFDDPDQS